MLRMGRRPALSVRTMRRSSISRIVSRRVMTASPFLAQCSARGRASMPTFLHRNPEAPARSVMSPTSSSSLDVRMTTRTSGAVRRISLIAARPSMPA